MDELRKWRENLPEGQRTLKAAAKLLGVSDAKLCQYEKGRKRIAPMRVPLIAKITGIPRNVLRPDVFGSAPE